MTSVDARANELGFGPLVARLPHPNGGVHAFVYWIWCVVVALMPLSMVLVVLTGGANVAGAAQGITLALVGVATAALAWLLGALAVGQVRRRAFYLYPQGYLSTDALGRVARAVPWNTVSRIEIPPVSVGVQLGMWGSKQRTICEIRHHRGRLVRFTEVTGEEVLAPLAIELHAQATQPSR